MNLVTKEEFLNNLDFYRSQILAGKIFIYPTDTIYGIGCIISSVSSIKKISSLKSRQKNKFYSIIVPNKRWIKHNFKLGLFNKVLNLLPGKYTFILTKKKCAKINNLVSKTNKVGVRLIDNWFFKNLKLNLPIITSSVNISGKKPMTSLDDIEKSILDGVDYVFYDKNDSKLDGNPSTLVLVKSKNNLNLKHLDNSKINLNTKLKTNPKKIFLSNLSNNLSSKTKALHFIIRD